MYILSRRADVQLFIIDLFMDEFFKTVSETRKFCYIRTNLFNVLS